MAKYVLMIDLPKGKSILSLKKTVEQVKELVHKSAPQGSHVTITKNEVGMSRSARCADAVSSIEDGVSQLEELQGELQDWYDNLSEGLQMTSKAEQVQQAADDLDGAVSEAREAFDEASSITDEVLDAASKEKLFTNLLGTAQALLATFEGGARLVQAEPLQKLRDAISDCKDLPEELQQTIQRAIDSAQSAVEDAQNVDFPGMY